MRNSKFVLLIALLISFYCCNKEKSENVQTEKTTVKSSEESTSDYYLNFYFPDTVNIKKTYQGKISYKGKLDSITTDFFIKGDTMRVLSLYLKDNKSHIKNDFKHILESKTLDTFYSLNDDGEILFKHKFNRLGINYLEGVLLDEVVIDTSATSDLTVHSSYNHITLPVFVTDDENIIDSFFRKENEKSDKSDFSEKKI